jgi:hypothetical protein
MIFDVAGLGRWVLREVRRLRPNLARDGACLAWQQSWAALDIFEEARTRESDANGITLALSPQQIHLFRVQ